MTPARFLTRTSGFRLALALAAPVALAACSDSDSLDDVTSGETLESVAPADQTSWLNTTTVAPDGFGYTIGNPDAPLKLAEYASHTCGACAAFAISGKPSLKKYIETGMVSFEQREVFLNTYDVIIATLATCGPAERMQPLSDDVWTNLQGVMGNIQNSQQAVQIASQLDVNQRFVRIGEVTGLIDFFSARGLSSDQARTCLADSEKIDAFVTASSEKAQAAEVTGTPTFTLNGRKLDVNQWPGLEPLLQAAGARLPETES